jgi:hypothetical protein
MFGSLSAGEVARTVAQYQSIRANLPDTQWLGGNSARTNYETPTSCRNCCLCNLDASRHLGASSASSATLRIQPEHLAPIFGDEPSADRRSHRPLDCSIPRRIQSACAAEVPCSWPMLRRPARRGTGRIRWLWNLHSLANTAHARMELVRPGHSQGLSCWRHTRCGHPRGKPCLADRQSWAILPGELGKSCRVRTGDFCPRCSVYKPNTTRF